MGQLVFKTKTTSGLTNTVHLKLNVEEKLFVASACEEIRFRCSMLGLAAANRRAFIRNSGLELFLDIIRLFQEEENVIAKVFPALFAVLREPGSVEYLLEIGGREVVNNAINFHIQNSSIKADGAKIMYTLLGKASVVAVRDIKRIQTSMLYKLPLSVAETMHVKDVKISEKVDNPVAFGAPEPEKEGEEDLEYGQKEGISRVVTSMKKYTNDQNVQVGGIEAMLVLAKHGVNPRIIVSAMGIEQLVSTMTLYSRNSRIQWRACLVITTFCDVSLPVCSEMGKRGIIPAVMSSYDSFPDNKDVRQMALWAMAALCKVEHCKQRLEEANLLILLYKLILIPIKSPGTIIDIVVPLIFLENYTHEQLEFAVNPPNKIVAVEQKATVKIKVGKPAFGTVDDFFTAGEPGLVDWD